MTGKKSLNILYGLIAISAIIGGLFLMYQSVFGDVLLPKLLFIESFSSLVFGIFTLNMLYLDTQ